MCKKQSTRDVFHKHRKSLKVFFFFIYIFNLSKNVCPFITLYFVLYHLCIKFPIFFLWLKVVKTLSWSILLLFEQMGMQKIYLWYSPIHCPQSLPQLWRLPLLEPGNVKKVYVTSFVEMLPQARFFLSLAFDVKTKENPTSPAVYM